MNEKELASRAQSGDVEAFGELYELFAQSIHDFLLRTVRNQATAEDLTQNTFVKAFEKRETLQDPTKVKSWLFTIAHNLAMDAVSRVKPTQDIEEQFDLAATESGPEAQAITAEAAELVWAAASSLEPRQYAVLDLTVRQGFSTPEVADALQVDSGHAAVLVSRSKEALGNAVRYLLVARRRTHCDTLAAMVPDGVKELTPEQRTSVDHHMRRCDSCKVMASSLTKPAEIVGGFAFLVLPATLAQNGKQQVINSLHSSLSSAKVSNITTTAAKAGKLAAHKLLVTAVIGVAVVAAGATAVVLHQRSASQTTASAGVSTSHSSAPHGGSPANATPTPPPVAGASDFNTMAQGLADSVNAASNALNQVPPPPPSQVASLTAPASQALRQFATNLRGHNWGSTNGDAATLATASDNLADQFDKAAAVSPNVDVNALVGAAQAFFTAGHQMESDLGIQGDPSGIFST